MAKRLLVTQTSKGFSPRTKSMARQVEALGSRLYKGGPGEWYVDDTKLASLAEVKIWINDITCCNSNITT